MKSIITLSLILSVSLVKAQTNAATPNANFEHWTHVSSSGGYDDPNQWQCLNPTLEALGYTSCYKDSANPKSGKYDVMLITVNVLSFQEAPAALTTGTINTTNQTINGGLPYTLRPDSMMGWYRYTSVSGDNGDCEFYLFGATRDTIGKAFFKTPTSTVSAWTRFALPITYLSAATPDTALWIFSSSINTAGAKTGSTLYIDSIGLVPHTSTGINELSVVSGQWSVYPNPSKGIFTIQSSVVSGQWSVKVYNVLGEEIVSNPLNSRSIFNIDLSSQANGVYFYSIFDEQNSIVKTGKMVVQK